MADGQSFDSLVELEVGIEQGSLRDARKSIEDGLADVEATVSPTGPAYGGGSGSGGGSNVASRERAMSRQLLSSQNNKLDTVTDSWGQNLELNERRNFLLEELLESTGTGDGGGLDGPTPRGSSSLLGGVAGGGASLLGMGALAIGGLGLGKLTDIKPPDIPPLEVPDIPPLKAPDAPELKVPDIPKLGVPEIPKLEAPNIPPLKAPDIPPLSVPDIPKLDVPDIPALGLPEIPDLGVPDPPTLKVPDVPPIPVAKPDWVPLPLKNPNGSGSGNGSPSVTDRVTTGVATNAAMTLDMVKQGGEAAFNAAGKGVNYAAQNPWKTGGAIGAVGLAAADGPLPFGDSAAMAALPMLGLSGRGGSGNSSQNVYSRPPTPRQSTVPPARMGNPSPAGRAGNRARERRRQAGGNVTVHQNFSVQGASPREVDRKIEKAKQDVIKTVRNWMNGGL